jgi:DNA polymerase III epsilon subunit family exonuclease
VAHRTPYVHEPVDRTGAELLLDDQIYAVLDIESTGFEATTDRIVEIGVVLEDAHGLRLAEFSTLINPDGRPVGASADAHQLTDAMLVDAPTFAEVAPYLRMMLHGAVMVAHHAAFDRAFLEAEFSRAGIPMTHASMLCTMEATPALLLDRVTGQSLEVLTDLFGIELGDAAHAALPDARATAVLLTGLLAIARGRHVGTLAAFAPCIHGGFGAAWFPDVTTVEMPRTSNRPQIVESLALGLAHDSQVPAHQDFVDRFAKPREGMEFDVWMKAIEKLRANTTCPACKVGVIVPKLRADGGSFKSCSRHVCRFNPDVRVVASPHDTPPMPDEPSDRA